MWTTFTTLFLFSLSLSPPSATCGKQWFILDSGCFSGPNNSVWDPTQDSCSTIGTLPFVISTNDKYWCDKMRCKLVPMSCNLLNIDRFGGRSCEILLGRGVSRELIREGKRREKVRLIFSLIVSHQDSHINFNLNKWPIFTSFLCTGLLSVCVLLCVEEKVEREEDVFLLLSKSSSFELLSLVHTES